MAKANKPNTNPSGQDYGKKFHESSIFHYTLLALVVLSLAISSIALTYTAQLKKALIPKTISEDEFFAKLNKHPELKGLQNEQPVGGQLDAASLSTLKQQFPDVYKDAKVGDFLLRYKTKLIIYDYDSDRIVNAVNLQ